MEPEALDYPGVLSKLLEILGRRVEVTIRGAGKRPPIFVDFEGVLERGDTRRRVPSWRDGTPTRSR